MQVTIEINGRQALPVRAIPLLTDWRGLSPDQLAQIQAGDSDFWPSFDGLTAYRLNPDGSTEPTPPRWWASWVVHKLNAISEAIKATQIGHETGRQQWRAQALAQLPAGVFVWRDEFEKAYVREYGPESLRARFNRKTFDPSVHALDFNPQPDPAIATQHLVLDGFVPISGAINQGRAQVLEWLNAPREKLPQERQDAFALWCEIDAIDQQVRELETTQPVGVTEILARRAALKELHTERARLLAVLDDSEPPQAAPAEPCASTTPDYSMLATRAQLIEAFGAFTGMDLTWFRNLKDTPALLNARKVTGQGGRGHLAEPLFCPLEVMQWLVSGKRKKGRPLSLEKAWELLERHFPKVHSANSAADPRAGD